MTLDEAQEKATRELGPKVYAKDFCGVRELYETGPGYPSDPGSGSVMAYGDTWEEAFAKAAVEMKQRVIRRARTDAWLLPELERIRKETAAWRLAHPATQCDW